MSTFSNLEFHRSGIGVLTRPDDPDPGSAVYLEHAAGSTRPLRFCSCAAGRRRTCKHLAELGKQLNLFRKKYHGSDFGEVFAATHWHRLAQLLFEGSSQPFDEVRVAQLRRDGRLILRLTSADGGRLLDYLDCSPDSLRFLERIAKVPPEVGFSDRSDLIEKLSVFLRTSEEQHLNRVDMKTNRQSFEDSIWFRLMYHCFREFEDDDGRFDAEIDADSGDFCLLYFRRSDHPTLRIAVPRSRVQATLAFLSDDLGDHCNLRHPPIPLESILALDEARSGALDWLPRVQALLDYAEHAPLASEFEQFVYGNLAYIPELQLMAVIDPEAPSRSNAAPLRLPTFTDPPRDDDPEPVLVLTDPTRELRILREFDFVEIEATKESGEDVRVQYAYGDQRIAIEDIVEAKRQGLPYLETGDGWVDLGAPELRGLETLISEDEEPRDSGLQLSSAQILRLKSSTSKPVHIEGQGDRAAILKRLLEFRPSQPLPELEGLTSVLRPYQKIGVEWLNFLYENRLAGLLCDDMGLGKTHQAMALMVLLREEHGIEDPVLVICPRTVISHWRDKLRLYAPRLRAAVYHGTHRDLGSALEDSDVLVASYGVLRNDFAELSQVPWALLVFDEVQQIKNQETQAYRAAAAVPARMKVGLTGTPIENSLSELKNLFDLILPGYMGDDDDYFDRYGASSREEPDESALVDLRRLISPFVLRRLKTAVLDELPEKIEDIRTCSLSDEQRQLYRTTIATRGAALAEKIRTEEGQLPYIHIFALLNLLKQICDHPALALGKPELWTEHSSSKWDLFVELLQESLDSDQKVVVFSQYLGMISMMESYLEKKGLAYATLTGSTRKRGEVVDRFNQDPTCRVFLGSLRAGGTGIDLVAGSVVIHYDRWWNAAKEDQATDRVYRIGQKRAVQVFKLVTEDTLEERIAEMIDRKRKLMSSVVQADHPRLGKIFTREELLELLRQID